MRPFALALLAALLSAAPAVAQEAATHQLAGFSSATFQGGAGVLTMNAACSQFGSEARMCNTLEVARTASPPTVSGNAWVRPAVLGNGNGATDAVNPHTSTSVETCSGWSASAGTFGPTVDDTGRFGSGSCGTAWAIACCTPIPEPAFAGVPGLIPWAAAFLGIGMAISAMLMPRVQRRQLRHRGRLIGPGDGGGSLH